MKSLSLSILCLLVIVLSQKSVHADVHIYQLDNGLTVRLVPMELDGQVVVLLGVKAGFFAEPAGKPHLAHIVEHAVFYNVDAALVPVVARWREENRANAETLADVMYFDLRVPADELESAIALQASRMKIGRFFNAVLEREVPMALAELDMVEKGPVSATSKFALAPFVQAALHGRLQEPIRERSSQLTVDDVQAFYSTEFQPSRAMLTIAGEFEPQQAMRLIARHLARLAHPKDAAVKRSSLRVGRHDATWDVKRKHVFVAFPMPALRDDDHASMTALAYVLWQRLNADPETRGAMLSAMLGGGQIDGVWLLSLALSDDATEAQVIEKLKQQLDAVSGPKAPSSGELRFAIESAKRAGILAGDPKDAPIPPGVYRALANFELQNLFMTLAYGDPRGYLRRIEAVTDVRAADTAQRRLKWDTASVVVVSPKR
jgi:predicted Zn-dependent peptidase